MTNKRLKLTQLTHDQVQARIIDPEGNQLPQHLEQQFRRVMTAARLIDDDPDEDHLVSMICEKYNCTAHTAHRDIELARQVYKTRHSFDWDFWHIWQIRDQLELIRQCKEKKDLKEWNNAKKTLLKMIGEKPEALADPNRMAKNQFFIQVNIGGKTEYKPIEEVHELRQDEVKEIIDIMQQPITEEQAAEIMDS